MTNATILPQAPTVPKVCLAIFPGLMAVPVLDGPGAFNFSNAVASAPAGNNRDVARVSRGLERGPGAASRAYVFSVPRAGSQDRNQKDVLSVAHLLHFSVPTPEAIRRWQVNRTDDPPIPEARLYARMRRHDIPPRTSALERALRSMAEVLAPDVGLPSVR